MSLAGRNDFRCMAALLVSVGAGVSLACSDSLTPSAQTGRPEFSVLPSGLTETLIASNLASPTAMAVAPDGRIFINEQCGSVRVVKNGVLLPTPLLTLATDCTTERGVLGVAFDPAFATNHRLYLYYTVTSTPRHNRVSAFIVTGDQASVSSEQILLDIDDLGAGNHNGGPLHFGPDGKLYIGVGDNNNSANSQTKSNLFGKLLRINPDGSIPSDNPFYATTTGRNRAIWALGLRNPYTFGFQPGTGRLFINDVGESTAEEINDGIAGSNYGWRTCEGPCSPTQPALRDPIYSYPHDPACAITGGTFYNPASPKLPASFVGKYFFADLCAGFIKVLDPSTRIASAFSTGLSFPVDLQVGTDGALYYLERPDGVGQVWRVTSTTTSQTTVTASVAAADKFYNGTTAAKVTGCTLSGNPSGVSCSAAASSFATAVVGAGKTVTATGITLSGANAANYMLSSTSATTTASINAVSVGATVHAANKVFDGTVAAMLTSCTLTGSPAGVSCSAAEAHFQSASAGTNKPVTATGLSLSGANAGNYVLTGTAAFTTANITSSGLTATVTAANKFYNGSAAAKVTNCSLNGNPAGVTCSPSSASFATPVVGSGKTVTATGITLGGPNAGAYTLSNTTATTTASITPVALGATVVAANKTFDGTTTATIISCSLTGSPAGVSCSAAEANFASAAVGNGKQVTATHLTLTGANSGNYTLTGSTAFTTANILAP